MRFTTVSDGIRKIGGLIEKSDDSGFNIGKIVSDPIIMSAIAAGIVLLVVIFAMVISKRKHKASEPKPVYEPPRYDMPEERPYTPPPAGHAPDPYAAGGKPVYEEDGLTIGGSLPVDRRFRSVSSVESGRSSESKGSADVAGGSLKRSRFSGDSAKAETPRKTPGTDEIVELYTFHHRTDIKICPYCDSENHPGNGTCTCCGGPLSS